MKEAARARRLSATRSVSPGPQAPPGASTVTPATLSVVGLEATIGLEKPFRAGQFERPPHLVARRQW